MVRHSLGAFSEGDGRMVFPPRYPISTDISVVVEEDDGSFLWLYHCYLKPFMAVFWRAVASIQYHALSSLASPTSEHCSYCLLARTSRTQVVLGHHNPGTSCFSSRVTDRLGECALATAREANQHEESGPLPCRLARPPAGASSSVHIHCTSCSIGDACGSGGGAWRCRLSILAVAVILVDYLRRVLQSPAQLVVTCRGA